MPFPHFFDTHLFVQYFMSPACNLFVYHSTNDFHQLINSRRWSNLEELLENSHGIIGTLHGMPNSPLILINLVIIATFERLVTKKVNSLVLDTIGKLGIGLDITKTVGLVPASRENIKGNHATYRVTG